MTTVFDSTFSCAVDLARAIRSLGGFVPPTL